MIDGRTAAFADRKPADGAGGIEIRLDEHRRQRLCIGDIVEVGAQLVERQPVGRVDGERQEIVDGATVLGTIEPLESPAAGVWRNGRRLVESVLQRLDQPEEHRVVRTSLAGWRHHPGPELADHPLGDLGLIGRRVHVEVLQ